ncbi:MAG: FMN-binding protein [Candidatus Dormibacteria bacterium]
MWAATSRRCRTPSPAVSDLRGPFARPPSLLAGLTLLLSAGCTPGAGQGSGPSPVIPGIALRDGTWTGSVVTVRVGAYGKVQVAVTVRGGRMVEVVAIQLPHDVPHSVEISDHVAPILHDEALRAQSAEIDVVSGATYTCEAYGQSLQSALDQARAQ